MPYSDDQDSEKSLLVERARSLILIQKTGQRELDEGEFRDDPDRTRHWFVGYICHSHGPQSRIVDHGRHPGP